ncbi:YdcF family protein [Mucilaginibacter robiniae]|uniref:YdcF family protein n=1 Tax=Mucilaginibacter robiniae TaxID=2728022 RepID=A0A7L5DZB3_9SPHI|nr:YdcF family protein [Mucilaginibacter robiniae]QJD95447.1 YdcF family protein [Mucilaginibacter robiniae]
MKKILLFVLFACTSFTAFSQAVKPMLLDKANVSANWMQIKNYYLLTLLQQDVEVSKMLINDPQLARLTKEKVDACTASLNCKEVSCFTANNKFSDTEIKLVSDRLQALYQPANPLGKLVQGKLTPSGRYNLYKDASPVELLVKAWEQDAAGINYVIDVYAGGQKPNYPQIDSISFNVKAKSYPIFLYNAAGVLAEDAKTEKLFFEPGMQAALLYLEINGRHDPANYEPMQNTVNKAAVEQIKITKWSTYPYSVILVPGAGADDLTTEITPDGMLRCRLAAQQYFKHAAPFIMVSGGKVHPYKTKYCEAEEMKKFLVETVHVPASAIIMEPHARHTTTNMRNGARLMFKYGIPLNKPGIVITDRSQTNGIINMAARCMRELKYVPYNLGKHISDTEIEFYPLTSALQINPYEPLDP